VQKEKSAGLFKVLINRDQRRIIISDYLKRINAIANLFQVGGSRIDGVLYSSLPF